MNLRLGDGIGHVLLRFEVSNHRSIREPVELSMIAVDNDRLAARPVDRLGESVLTVAGVYGPNASGKSNVLGALAWVSGAVRSSLRAWDEFVPREPFRFGDGPTSPTGFQVEMAVDGVRHAYVLEVDDGAVLFEGLYSYPERRRRTLMEREGADLHIRRGLGSAAGIRELLTPTTLALSAAMRLDEPAINPFARALAGMVGLGIRQGGARDRWRHSAQASGLAAATGRLFLYEDLAAAAPGDRERALELLRFADLGIEDVDVAKELDDDLRAGPQRRRLRFVHRVVDQRLAFELEDESAGTQTWFRAIGPVLNALRHGRALLFDEIDASLHPRLSARLIELFQDPETNPLGAQLLFTSHDTSLLGHLNRDEVWLTEKGADGATTLTALAEYGGEKVRRSLNLERAYLQGRFGAVPELEEHLLRRAVGDVGEAV